MVDGSDQVEFHDVDVFASSDIAMLCRINDKTVTVQQRSVLRGSEVAQAGDRGRLVLMRGVAVGLDLA